MTTTTTHSAGPRIDWPGKEMRAEWDQYFQITRYPEIGLYIHTGHNRDGTVTTTITEYFTGLDGPLYRKDYDPMTTRYERRVLVAAWSMSPMIRC